jgi:hypothetical protein
MAPAQQSAFLHNAQLPGLDMATVLQGITPEQLAYIGQLYQAGQIPLPPAPGPAHTPAAAVQTPPVAHQAVLPPAVNMQEEDPMSGDKEDGEWEEGEVAPQVVPDFLRPPPTGPRKRSSSFHTHAGQNGADKRTKRQPSPPRQPPSYDRRRPAASSKQSPDVVPIQTQILTRNEGVQSVSSPRSHARQRAAKHEAAKAFILATYRAGYSFDDLAREVGDARMLRILFKELGLNAPAETLIPKQPKQPEVIAASSQAVRGQPTPVVANKPVETAPRNSPLSTPTAKPTVKPVAKPVVPPKAPATADRSAYLAKLQAAKNKKNEDMLKSSKAVDTSTENETVAMQQPPPVVAAPITQTEIQPAVQQQPRKAVVQTDLIRKRLEALKGEQARRQEAERLASAQGAATPSSAPAVETATPTTNAAQAMTPISIAETTRNTPYDLAERTIVSPVQSFDFTSQFPGLPGLFMTGTPPQVPAALRAQVEPVASSNAPAAPESVEMVTSEDSMDLDRSVSADDTPAPKEASEQPQAFLPAKPSAFSSGQATPKHPFNQGKYDSNDDSVIIHVSDEEESELDDMDEDEESAPAPTPANRPAVVKPGPIRNFPAPASASVSAPGTPGATTPGGTAYQRKLQEIQEMNRRIAERQKQPKKTKTQPALPSAAVQLNASAPLPGLSTNVPSVAAAVAQPKEEQAAESNQQMEAKLARLKEEAAVISEQRQAPQSNNGNNGNAPTTQAVDSGVAEHADSDMSDDDDAMDLSNGEDSDSSDEDDVKAHVSVVASSTSGGHGNEAQSLGQDDANGAAQEDDDSSSSDNTDSSTESEEESDEDYEPAPAVPEVNASNPVAAVTRSLGQGEHVSLPSPETKIITTQPALQFDADLAPELQPSTREEAEPTPEVFYHATAVLK